jgi:hypothetical protein
LEVDTNWLKTEMEEWSEESEEFDEKFYDALKLIGCNLNMLLLENAVVITLLQMQNIDNR